MEGLHLNQVDQPAKRIVDMRRPQPHRHLQNQRPRPQALLDLLHRADKISPLAVELVDQGHAGNAIFVGLTPDRFALCLDPLACGKNDDSSVENPQAAFHLSGEIDMARRVDQVHRHIPPVERHRRRVDRDPPLLLLGIEIGDRGATIDIAEAMAGLGKKQHPFGERGLAGVDMRHDADVANGVEWPRHDR